MQNVMQAPKGMSESETIVSEFSILNPALRGRSLGPLAQLAEQQTLNLRVLGSIPRRLTNPYIVINNLRVLLALEFSTLEQQIWGFFFSPPPPPPPLTTLTVHPAGSLPAGLVVPDHSHLPPRTEHTPPPLSPRHLFKRGSSSSVSEA